MHPRSKAHRSDAAMHQAHPIVPSNLGGKRALGHVWSHKNTERRKMVFVILALALVLVFLVKLARSPEKRVPMDGEQKAEPPGDDFSSLLREKASNRQIIITFAATAFGDLALNLLCSLGKLGLTNFIIGALDKPMLDLLRAKGYPVFPALEHSVLGANADKLNGDPRQLGSVKEEAVVWALEDGYEVILTDADLIWVRNPIKDLIEASQGFDFAFQTMTTGDFDGHDVSGGLLYAKPSEGALNALNRIITTSYQGFPEGNESNLRKKLCRDHNRKTNTTCSDPTTGARSVLLASKKYVRFDEEKLQKIDLALQNPYLLTIFYKDGTPWTKELNMKTSGLWSMDENKNCIE